MSDVRSAVPFVVFHRCRVLSAFRHVPSGGEHFLARIAREAAAEVHQALLDDAVAAWRAEDPAGFEAVMADLRRRAAIERTPWLRSGAEPRRPQVSIAKVPEDFGPVEVEDESIGASW